MLKFELITGEKNKKWQMPAAQAVMVYLVLLSIFYAFFSVFYLEIEGRYVFLTVGGTVAASAFVMWNKKYFWQKTAGIILTGVLFGIFQYQRMYFGALAYIRSYIELYNQFYFDDLSIDGAEADLFSKIIILVSIGLLFSFILLVVLKKKKLLWLFVLLMLLPVILSAIVGKMPETFSCIFLMVSGCFYVVLYYHSAEKWPVRDWTVTAVLLAAVVGSSAVIQPLIMNYKNNHIEAYQNIKQSIKDSQNKTISDIENIEIGSIGGGIAKGKIKNLTSFNPTGKKVMEVSVKGKPDRAIYLRAFVGSEYVNEGWQEISKGELSEVIPLIGGQDEARELMNEPFRRVDEGPNGFQKYSMEITFSGISTEFGYAPYLANITSEQDVYKDSYIKGSWSQKRSYDFYLQSDGGLDEPSDLWKEYAEFVKTAYVGEYSDLKQMRTWIESIEENLLSEGMGQMDMEMRFAGLMESGEYGYSRNPGKMPSDMDLIEGFLFEKKVGFCVHYATAATLYFQMSGQPARYVEGYVIQPQDFRFKDGVWKATVTDEDAHAWCEVFESDSQGRGWEVRDYTPGNTNGNTEDIVNHVPADDFQDISKDDEFQNEEPDEPIQKNPQEPLQNQNSDNGQQNILEILGGNGGKGDSETSSLWKRIVVAAGTALLVISLFWIMIWFQQKLRRRKKLKSFRRIKNNKGILKIYSEIYELCLFAGLKVSEESEKEKVKKMAEMFPQILEEDWMWIYNVAEKAAFSGRQFSREDQKKIYLFYQKLRREILKTLSRSKKVWFLYGRVL